MENQVNQTNLRNFLILVARTEAKRQEKVKGLMPEDIQRIIDGTLGFDFAGDRYPIDQEALNAYFRIMAQWKELESITGKKDENFERWRQELNAELYARCHTRENVPTVLANVIGESIIETTQYKPPSEEELKKKIQELKKT